MPVYKQYNQEELDLQYNNRYHVPDFETSLTSWETLSRQAEKKYRVIKDIPYGNMPRESLDVFPSPDPGSKTLIFIHGGYWQMFDKSSFHFVAGAFAEYGITTVLLNYPLAPFASMDQIVSSCRNAVHWLHKNLRQMNGDPAQIYVLGHSAGGHLAAMLMTTEDGRGNQYHLRGVCVMSGIFDLIPIQRARHQRGLADGFFNRNRNSPVQLTPAESCPLIIAVGTAETDEFKNQSSEIVHHWKNRSTPPELVQIPGLNHFTILDSLCHSDSICFIGLSAMLMNGHYPLQYP